MILQNKLLIYLLVIFTLGYIFLLSNTGSVAYFEQEKKLSSLNKDISNLKVENEQLRVKNYLLKSNQEEISKEARKYYLLNQNAKIIKYKEKNKYTNLTKTSLFKNPYSNGKEEKPSLELFRFFYISFCIFIWVGVYLKLRRKVSKI